jgi:N-acetylmuramoyl-L-alanine amidase
MKQPLLTALITVACLGAAAPRADAQTARDMYNRALAQERTVRDEAAKPTLVQMRRAIAAYEAVVRRHPASGYADNALWQAANLATLAFERFGEEKDRKSSARLLAHLAREYPSSKLAAQAAASAPPAAPAPPPAPAPAAPTDSPAPVEKTSGADVPAPARNQIVTLRDITRTVLPDGVRITVDLESEVPYHQEEITNPRRLFFDLRGVKTASTLQDASLRFEDDVVKEVRLGRHPRNTTRLVVDLEGVSSYSVYPLYGPYRLVIDFRRAAAASPAHASPSVPAPAVLPPPIPAAKAASTIAVPPEARPTVPEAKGAEPPKLPSTTPAPKVLPPAAPASNSNGKFSLSRQLGLSVSRIVIDAGHGGHDPGANGHGLTESELTLDVAQRLRKLLEAQPGMDVVMTRDSDVFIPLEERAAIANREGADLFLSIHANASRNPQARGIETYFLSFALNPEAEAVAARENATSSQAMHNLPEIVKAIALNNKLKESRDFAATVQKSMAKRLATKNRSLRDLGVKQAPFVVLIGAVMPSVLAEISFVTNRQESALLKTSAYRQQIAQALFDAVQDYQQSLKKMNAIAAKKATAQ